MEEWKKIECKKGKVKRKKDKAGVKVDVEVKMGGGMKKIVRGDDAGRERIQGIREENTKIKRENKAERPKTSNRDTQKREEQQQNLGHETGKKNDSKNNKQEKQDRGK